MRLSGPIFINGILVLGVYLADKHTPAKKLPHMTKQIIVGIIFGCVSAFASSFGVEWLGAVVNVRDAAPLSAGLIFGAPAGIISGIIGGLYRWFSVYWGAGTYTQLACSIATVLAGLMESKDHCDITISIDCDGQDDINAMDEMVDAYLSGCEIVYGVRSKRDTDTFFKRFTAQSYYKVLKSMGVEAIYNHADYRLVSSRVLQEFACFKEVNLFLRGMFPLVGFKSTSVYYERHERIAGKSHYPLRKMLALAFEGITSLSVKPLHIITTLGGVIAALSFVGVLWTLIVAMCGAAVPGWASMTCITCFIGGVQLTCLGVIGEYIGKIYLEVKQRPRYIISDRTEE